MSYNVREFEAAPVEPVTVAEARDHCEIPASETQHDAKLARFIKAARQAAENYMSRRIVQQTLELVLDDWPYDGIVRLPEGELRELISVKYLDPDGNEQTWPSVEYRTDNSAKPPRLWAAPTFALPRILSGPAPITIRYKVGYPPVSGSPVDYLANVPEDIRVAILLTVGTWFENREDVIVGTISSRLPLGVDRLLDPYRIWGV